MGRSKQRQEGGVVGGNSPVKPPRARSGQAFAFILGQHGSGVWNGAVSRRPAIVAFCKQPEDVQEAARSGAFASDAVRDQL
jgi:hypothetical protein